MYLNIEELRAEFEKEKGLYTGDYPFTYIDWLEAKIINSEKNNAKTHVIGRREPLFCDCNRHPHFQLDNGTICCCNCEKEIAK